MANEKRLIPLNKRIIYGGDVFYSLMSEKNWSATEAADFVSAFRTVYAVEVVHGRWKKAHINGYLKCNQCEDAFIYADWLESGKWNYCPNCGAKMDGDGDG